MLAQIRKALIATLVAFLTGFAPAWAQAHGFPGWDTTGGLAIFAALSGLAVWAVPNKRAVPDAVLKLRADAAMRAAASRAPDVTLGVSSSATAIPTRAAARSKPGA